MLFEGKSPLRKCLNFDGLSKQVNNWAAVPRQLEIGHSRSIYIPVEPKYIHWSSPSKQKSFLSNLYLALQQTTHKPNICSLLQGCGFELNCSEVFLYMYLSVVHSFGAKIGLKLMLELPDM